MAGDCAYYVLSTAGPYYSSNSIKALTEKRPFALYSYVNSELYPQSAELH